MTPAPSTPSRHPSIPHSTSLPIIPTFSPSSTNNNISTPTRSSSTSIPTPTPGKIQTPTIFTHPNLNKDNSTPSKRHSIDIHHSNIKDKDKEKEREKDKHRNYHPYLIQTTSSSLLSRTNASPSQPIYEGGSRHRVSRSMSALNRPDLLVISPGGGGDIVSPTGKEGNREIRKNGVGFSRKRSGSGITGSPFVSGSESGLSGDEGRRVDLGDDGLPIDARAWNPSELARYLVHTLRTGGVDGTGQVLPKPLVEDIKTWVLRHQISGKLFLKGPDEWAEPPPFLPLLSTLSRRLRRASFQNRISSSTSAPLLTNISHSPVGKGSVLFEEDEITSNEEDGIELSEQLTGVKRMAYAYVAKSSSASEVSDNELSHAAPLRPQWTGGSDRVAAWKKWEIEQRNPVQPLKPDHTGSSAGGYRKTHVRKRRESETSAGGLADAEDNKTSVEPLLQGDQERISAADMISDGEDDDRNGTIKASLARPSLASAMMTGSSSTEGTNSNQTSATSPPPPYRSPDLATEHAQNDGSMQPSLPAESRESSTPDGSKADHSATPTPDHPRTETRYPSPKIVLSPREHLDKNENSSTVPPSRPYGDLGLGRGSTKSRSSTTRRRKHAIRQSPKEEDEDEDFEGIRGITGFSTARRVTIKPTPAKVSGFFDPPIKSAREEEMEKQMEIMMERIKELEGRLESVEQERAANTRVIECAAGEAKDDGDSKVDEDLSTRDKSVISRPTSPVFEFFTDSILGRHGLDSCRDDGDNLPRRVRELPGYLFLVGFGVGAVVVRVLFSRR